MTDVFTPEQRSAVMARIRGRDTGPEKAVRSLLHRAGYRFRLHRRDLPGTPDIVLPARRTAIQVHGCFWHGHAGCRYAARPKTREAYWARKIDANRERDVRMQEHLEGLGWRVVTVWECELRAPVSLLQRLRECLGEPGRASISERRAAP